MREWVANALPILEGEVTTKGRWPHMGHRP